MITREELARMYPRAIPEWLDAMAELAPVLCKFYGFNRLDWVHLAGQVSAETSGLSLARMQENMTFTTTRRILEVYSYRLGVALQREPALKAKYGTKEKLAQSLVRNPKELADLVYGGREGTPWRAGSRYIGRGPTQITHLNNYHAIDNEIARQPGGENLNLVAHPEKLADDPELGIRSAFADWHIKGLSRWAQKDDCDTLSDALNTGNIRDNVKPHGLPMRRSETAKAKRIWWRPMNFDAAGETPVSETHSPAPITKKDLPSVSRKARWIIIWRRVSGALAAAFSISSLLEYLGMFRSVLSEVNQIFSDNAVAIAIAAALFAFIGLGKLITWMMEDVEDGRYVPSKAPDASSDPATP
jgi:putative chitinase